MTENKLQTLLIIEDDKTLQEILFKKFDNERYRVLLADDGKEGLRMAVDFHPDVILLDLILPKMDGVETLNQLRKDVWGKTAKVIVLSNLTYLGDDVEKLDDKVEDHLVKAETKLEEVVKKVEEVIARE